MNGHFAVVNKRGVITTVVLLIISIILFSLSLAKKLSGGGVMWMIPLTVFIIIFILAIILLVSVLTAGIDVNNSEVIFADATGKGGKQPRFKLSQLRDIELRNADGIIENPETSSLIGGRIIFILKDKSEMVYYPVSLTYKQYEKVRTGLLQMAEEDKTRRNKKKK